MVATVIVWIACDERRSALSDQGESWAMSYVMRFARALAWMVARAMEAAGR